MKKVFSALCVLSILASHPLLAAPEDDVKHEQPEEADTCGDVVLTTEPGGAAKAALAMPLRFVLPATLQVTSGAVSADTIVKFRFAGSSAKSHATSTRNKPRAQKKTICQYRVPTEDREVRLDELVLSRCTRGLRANGGFTAEAMRLSVVSAESSDIVARIRLPRARCTPSVPVVPPLAATPPGAGDFDEESFLQTLLPVTTDNVKQIDHPQSGFNVVPDEEAASSNIQSASSLVAAASSGFESVHPVAVTTFGDRIFVFGVASNGRVMFQIFGYNQGVGLWLSRWEEVPGGLRTDRRVTATAAADMAPQHHVAHLSQLEGPTGLQGA